MMPSKQLSPAQKLLILLLLAGGSLGLSGVLLQTFTRNPLADSSTLGINAGVGLVLTLAVTQLNLTDPFLIHYLPFLAIPGGLAMVALSTILTSSLIAITGRVDTHKLNYVVSWLAGHTTGSNWDSLSLAGPVLILLWILSYTQALPLNLLQLSDPAALGLGLPLRRPLDWRPPTPHRRHPHPHLPNRQQHPYRHSPHPHR